MRRKNVLFIALVAVLLVVGLTAPAVAGKTRIGVGLDGSGVGDLSFNDMAHAGVVAAQADFPIRVQELGQLAPSGRWLTYNEIIRALSRRNDLVVAVGFNYADAIATAAEKRPDVHFALIDAYLEADNVASLWFAAHEGSFLVGAAAAMTTETHTIGFIGGVDMELINSFEAGFAAGVHYVDPDAEVLVDYVSTPPDWSGFGDPAGAYAIATEMYEQGADVVYHAAGFSGLGLFEAARDYSGAHDHVWAIGVDADQYLTMADDLKPFILTSMMKRVDLATYDIIEAEVTGTFTGGLHYYDLAAGGVGYATSGGFIDHLVDELDAIAASIIDGTIVVPTVP